MGQADDKEDLYRQYLPRILNFVRLRVSDEALAQDLTASTFEKAVEKQHTLRQRDAFGAWLFRIARNTVAGHYRRRRTSLSLDDTSELPAGGPTPPEAIMRREELTRLERAIATLSVREQEIVSLKFGSGLGNQEIAAVMSLRPGHVAVLIFRALRKLRARLEEERSRESAMTRPEHDDE